MRLVQAEKEQIEAIVGMSKRAFWSDILVGATEVGGPPEYDSVPWHEKMREEGHLFQAMEGDALVGAAILFLHEGERSLYVGRIFIDVEYHRRGYGRKLMTCIEELYPHVRELFLDTPLWNERTNSFYLKMGYVEQKRDPEMVYYKKTV